MQLQTRSLLAPLAFGLLLAPGTAQKRYVVDAAGGAGSHFRSIHDAIQRAAAGDILIVRKGVYAPFLLRKGLSILGEPGATVRIPSRGEGTWIDRVRGTVRVHGLHFDATDSRTFTPLLHISNCTGRVLLSEVTTNRSSTTYAFGVQLEKCSSVTIDRCTIQHPLILTDAVLNAADTQFKNDATSSNSISAKNSRLVLGRCGASAMWRSLGLAINLTNSHCELRGDGTRSYYGSGASTPIRVDSKSTLVHDPDLRGSSPLASGTGTITARHMAWLSGKGGTLGQPVDLELGSSAGDTFRMFVGVAGARTPVPGLGDVWLDPFAFLKFQSGTQPASGKTAFRRHIPSSPNLLGLPIAYQALNANRTTGLSVSNAVSFVLR